MTSKYMSKFLFKSVLSSSCHIFKLTNKNSYAQCILPTHLLIEVHPFGSCAIALEKTSDLSLNVACCLNEPDRKDFCRNAPSDNLNSP